MKQNIKDWIQFCSAVGLALWSFSRLAECVACGLPLPYDAEALHSERQALRDRINLLEGEP